MRQLIGHLTITEPYVVTQFYETASFYTNHEVQPGTYEVYVTGSAVRVENGIVTKWFPQDILVQVDTVIRQESMPNSFFGVQFGEGADPARIGTASTHLLHAYAYQVPASVQRGECEWLGGMFVPVNGQRFEDTSASSTGSPTVRPVLDDVSVESSGKL